MSLRAARYVTTLVQSKPDALICIAAGHTPQLTCDLIAQIAKKENIDFSRCYFVSLDEWVGIPRENEGSCQYFLRNYLLNPLRIPEKNIHLFDGMSDDTQQECVKMDKFIDDHGGIDLMIAGVGRNGHVGFNEPGMDFYVNSHVIDLDETTQSVGQKYFREETKLTHGITLGLQHLLDARKAVLIANGDRKAAIMKEAIEGNIDPRVPASVIRQHADGEIILDREAASQLSPSS